MGALLGTQKAPKPAATKASAAPHASSGDVTDKDRAVLELKVQRDNLKKYRVKTNEMILRETAMAKKLAAEGQRERALLCLKKKRVQQTALDRAQGMLDNIQEMIDEIDRAAFQAEVFQALQQGTEALKAINSHMDIDEIENLMLDTREAIEYQQRVSEALSGQLTAQDDEDIDAELAAIAAEGIQFPEVPVHTPVGAGAVAVAGSASSDSVEVPAATAAKTAARGRVAAAAQ